MANSTHIEMLIKGVSAWNEWRWDNLEITPDLRGVSLKGIDLRPEDPSDGVFLVEADLKGANLSEAYLTWANLSGANLEGANLKGADLQKAYMDGTNLCRTILTGSNLSEAILQNAKLEYTDLSFSNLHWTDFHKTILTSVNFLFSDIHLAKFCETELNEVDFTHTVLREVDFTHSTFVSVRFWETVFANVDLSNVKGIETCEHIGPSYLDIQTLHSSILPKEFMRGCGLSEKLINELPLLLMQSVQYYSCFISYSSVDEEFAQHLHSDLQNKGIRCWFAPHDMKIGERIRPAIDEAIRIRDKVLLILSMHSIDSNWVEKEVETAFDEENRRKNTVLFPIRLDDSVMENTQAWAADIRRTRNIGDFRKWKDHKEYNHAFDRLLQALRIPNSNSSAHNNSV